jgi:hypothetical protein
MPKNKKNIKVHDLKPSKDAKGGNRAVQSHGAASHGAASHGAASHGAAHRSRQGQGGHQGR